MRRLSIELAIAIAIALCVSAGQAQSPSSGPYKVLKTAKVGGTGGFDYVYADVAGRRLYIPRGGVPATATAPAIPGRVTVFNLDTLAPAGEIANTRGNGAAVDPKSGHGFASSKPVAMWDTNTLAPIKTIDVQGNPDGILFDSFNDRVYVFSHAATAHRPSSTRKMARCSARSTWAVRPSKPSPTARVTSTSMCRTRPTSRSLTRRR